MKTIITLSILVLSICAFGQSVVNPGETTTVPGGAVVTTPPNTVIAGNNKFAGTPKTTKKGTIPMTGGLVDASSDTIGIAHVGFPEASQKMFSESQAEIAELQKQLQEKTKKQDDMFALLCGAAVPPVDPKKVIKDGVQIKPGELILKYRK